MRKWRIAKVIELVVNAGLPSKTLPSGPLVLIAFNFTKCSLSKILKKNTTSDVGSTVFILIPFNP